jgi:hypothetical protein
MSRNGKIACLPQPIREQVNRRLLNDEEARSIIQWLNGTPEVLALLAAEFDGRPINKVNISHWKSGGYRDWLTEQQAQDAIHSIVESSGALHDKIPENFNDHMNRLLIGTLAAEFIQAQRTGNAAKRSEAFGEWVLRYARIRRADVQARRLEIERERLAVQRNKTDENRRKSRGEMLEMGRPGPHPRPNRQGLGFTPKTKNAAAPPKSSASSRVCLQARPRRSIKMQLHKNRLTFHQVHRVPQTRQPP